MSRGGRLARRAFVRKLVGFILTAGAVFADFFRLRSAPGQSVSSGAVQPEEKVETTIKRLFSGRTIASGDGKLKVEMPLIAEDGSNVPITVQAELPMTASQYVKSIYIISDNNRRPLNARFSFTPEAGKAFIATSLRLGMTTDVRAVAEMNDGALYMVKKEITVTVSGCGG
jgi:sulfur-oxidizing protein SoxY